MKNKKTFKAIIICITLYMLLSWFVAAGNFADGEYANAGFNQLGILDFFLSPFNLFNYYVVTMTQGIDGYVNQVGYGNIIIAIITIGIFYGVLNKTGAYYNLIMDLKKKLKPKKEIFLIIIAIIYFLISALSGLNLILLLFFPFIVTVLTKLKFNKITTFMATIGAMLIGQIGSIYNPTINGLNRILFQTEINDNLITHIILLLILLIILVAFLLLSKNKESKKEEELILFARIEQKKKKSYIPIIISTIIMTIILFICMYNWYYMFDTTSVSAAYDTIINTEIKDYNFMQNLFGTSEQFGYWTGFMMSALLIIDSFILSFLYNIKLDDLFDGMKKGLCAIAPTAFYGILSLTIIIISLNNSDSFLYSIINNIFNVFEDNQLVGVFLSGLLHNFFINDYFALLSSLSSPLVDVYGSDSISISLLITQISHGLVSLITPFNIYLIAGLTYLNIPYTKWFKYIWKLLLLLIVLTIIIIIITMKFM